ncbi:response regulator [Tardiphaga sp. 20_F10_N6_6]|jgi:CheY-like chemotaxis protein|uniref:response regulator n=1 Tax=unclassified Tardiphaga TaxID=2631404 RepID=UPI003F279D4D
MIDSFVKVVDVLSKLAGALAWPMVFIVCVWWFKDALREFIANMSEGSFKLFGFEGVAKRKAIEATATAEVEKRRLDPPTTSINLALDSIGKSHELGQWLAHISLGDVAGKRILWVDDRPENNIHETDAFRALGIEIDFALNTEDAIRLLKSKNFDAVISDMARQEDTRAGYSLLSTVRELRPTMPFILYSSSNTSEERRAIISQGAYGSTTAPSELVRMAISAMRENPQRSWSRHAQAIRNLKAHRNRS